VESLATIVVTPRERFSYATRSLESICANTRAPFELVYVDGGTPKRISREIGRICEERGFRVVSTERYLSPNQARNLALPEVRTRYAVFVDNDIIVTPGWLEKLVACAEETGAWVAGPLYCIGTPEHERVHMAGGLAHIEESSEGRTLVEEHRFQNQPLAACRADLKRAPCEMVEFHTMLVRMDAFQKLGPLDEALLASREHIDFCLSVRGAGGEVYFEPDSLLTYVPPPPFHWSDVPFYLLRWSDGWAAPTYEHFNEKWKLTDDPTHLLRYWIRRHRRVAFKGVQERLTGLLGKRLGGGLAQWLVERIEPVLIRAAARKGAREPRS